MPRKLVAVVGPTASGKSALAVQLARRFRGEIVNGDSRQLYRGMEVGTAAPSAADRGLVPHHLYGHVDPRSVYSLALYKQEATAALDRIWADGRVPFLVGGTGQYVWALLEEWQVPEVPPNDALRMELTAFADLHGPEALHERLRQVDPLAAERLDARNVRRVVRALEVYEETGRPISDWQQKGTPAFEVLTLGIRVPAKVLEQRITERVEAMYEYGLVAEVKALLAAGVPADAPAMTSIGYREMVRMISGEITVDEAKGETVRATRRLARRQMQWFRLADRRIHWVDVPATAAEEVRSFLS